jgi:pimeloyl-ACP methyl ester carboxylesterase
MTVTLIQPGAPRGILLFGPGAGGDPARYRHLLDAASSAGYIVAAPVHERFDGRYVTDDQMRERAVGLKAALDQTERPDLPVVAAGHSAGAWAALCLAGGVPWGRDGRPLQVPTEPRVTRLVMLAPTLGWFQAPGALDQLTVPTVALVGSADVVTPPAGAEFLRVAPADVDVRTYDGVGHFDFMSQLPPGIEPTAGLDHDAFLTQLAADFTTAIVTPSS